MAKAKKTVRSYDKPDFAISDGKTTIKVFALTEHESIPNHLSTVYDHHWQGPGLVYESVSPQSRRCDHMWANDPSVWKWISKMVRDGLTDGFKVVSECQE